MLPNYDDNPMNFYNVLRKLSADQLKSEWLRTSEEDYYQMLECLPPIRWTGKCFMVGECMTSTRDGDIYECFIQVNNKYYKRPALIDTFSPSDYLAEIASIPAFQPIR